MSQTSPHAAARAVTLLETVVLLTVAALLAAMLSAAIAESRRHASLTQNFANLQQFAAGTTTYAADFEDRVWSFTDDLAAPMQGVEIIRSQIDGRPDLAPLSNVYWPFYSHLVLLKHLDARLHASWVVSPEDDILQAAQRDPDGWPFDETNPRTALSELFAYRSSYELGTAFTAPDSRLPDGRNTTNQHGLQHNRWNAPGTTLGNRYLHEVSFPSQKAMVYEREQRHFGPRRIFFMDDEARIPILCGDGSASTRRTADANAGFRPNQPRLSAPSLVTYQPESWEAPTLNGNVSQTVSGHYRWTRGGIKGRDFDATEIDTSDW